MRLEAGDPTITKETKSKARIALTNKMQELEVNVNAAKENKKTR
jgi:hypothetical protein